MYKPTNSVGSKNIWTMNILPILDDGKLIMSKDYRIWSFKADAQEA